MQNILNNYSNENNGVLTNLHKVLNHGKLAKTGRLLILPVDQGFEHGPDKSFALNSAGYDPEYLHGLAVEGKFNAYVAPLGLLENSSNRFIGRIPTILKLNNNNAFSNQFDQAITSSVKDALRLGCVGVGFTIYPGSDKFLEMIEEAKEVIAEAKSHGLFSVIWSYPRGPNLSKQDETAIDVCAYAIHIAALIGAHIIKVKVPTDNIVQKNDLYKHIDTTILSNRISHVMKSAFNSKKIVIFSGGQAKDEQELLKEIIGIKHGGGYGSIIGRNIFQREKKDALGLLNKIYSIYN